MLTWFTEGCDTIQPIVCCNLEIEAVVLPVLADMHQARNSRHVLHHDLVSMMLRSYVFVYGTTLGHLGCISDELHGYDIIEGLGADRIVCQA